MMPCEHREADASAPPGLNGGEEFARADCLRHALEFEAQILRGNGVRDIQTCD